MPRPVLLLLALLPFSGCRCSENLSTAVHLAITTEPFDGRCVLQALERHGYEVLDEPVEEIPGVWRVGVGLPDGAEPSRYAVEGEGSADEEWFVPYRVGWSEVAQEEPPGMFAGYHVFPGRFGPALGPAAQKRAERTLAILLGQMATGCGVPLEGLSCERFDEEQEGLKISPCLTIGPREEEPPFPPEEPPARGPVGGPPPPEGLPPLPPHVIEAMANGTPLEEVPEGTLPGPPRPEGEGKPNPGDGHPPPPLYPDELYEAQP